MPVKWTAKYAQAQHIIALYLMSDPDPYKHTIIPDDRTIWEDCKNSAQWGKLWQK